MLFLFIYLIYGEDDICINKDDLILDDCSKDNVYMVKSRLILIEDEKKVVEVGINKSLFNIMNENIYEREICVKVKCRMCKLIKKVGSRCGRKINMKVLIEGSGVINIEVFKMMDVIVKYMLIVIFSMCAVAAFIFIVANIFKKNNENMDEEYMDEEVDDIDKK